MTSSTGLGDLDRRGQTFERSLIERRFRGDEQLALLEANVIVEQVSQLSGLIDRELTSFQPNRFAPDRQMLVEHARDARTVDFAVSRPTGEEHFLLDPKMASAIALPEGQEFPCGGVDVLGLAQLLGGKKSGEVLSGEGLECLGSFHGVPLEARTSAEKDAASKLRHPHRQNRVHGQQQ